MKPRETLLGLLVLALVLGGVWWARGRSHAGSPVTAESAAKAAAPGGTAEASIPDVTLADQTVDLGDVRLSLSVAPRPILAFARSRFRARAEAAGAPVALENGRVSFEMTMPMGDHRYTLVPGTEGWQEAEVVLPLCGSGKRRWFATLEGTVAGKPRTARFQLDLTPPSGPPAP
ncbi:MAG: hypothetical protein IPL90_13060 [Holophagales bacterium]|nr:hypothetical protein [Holophagales bacterium]